MSFAPSFICVKNEGPMYIIFVGKLRFYSARISTDAVAMFIKCLILKHRLEYGMSYEDKKYKKTLNYNCV